MPTLKMKDRFVHLVLVTTICTVEVDSDEYEDLI